MFENKEELKQEAKNYAEENKMNMIDYHDSLFMEEAYLAGAEPREKHIAELERENAELEKQNSKAKELLTRFVMASVYFNGNETGLIIEAERFLKEIKND